MGSFSHGSSALKAFETHGVRADSANMVLRAPPTLPTMCCGRGWLVHRCRPGNEQVQCVNK